MIERNTTNPFIESLKKNLGREVTVVIYDPTGIKKLKGKCESIDFQTKAVIIRDEKNTFTIPRYLWIERARPKK